MATAQEWLSENSSRNFPFVSDGSTLPRDFLTDLRLFSLEDLHGPLFLSSVEYVSPADVHTLEDPRDYYMLGFRRTSNPAGPAVVFEVMVQRLNLTSLRTHFSEYQFVGGNPPNKQLRLIASTGASWHTPAWGDPDATPAEIAAFNPLSPLGWHRSWTRAFTPGQTTIEPCRVNDRKLAFKRLMLSSASIPEGEEDPLPSTENQWPSDVTYKLSMGYNIEIAADGRDGTAPGVNEQPENLMIISALPGAGAGYQPQPAPEAHPPIRTINGGAPNENGQFSIQAHDCLRYGPLITEEVGGPVVHTSEALLQSDCLPCCACKNYRASVEAIQKKAAKIQQMNETLKALYEESLVQYESIRLWMQERPPRIVV